MSEADLDARLQRLERTVDGLLQRVQALPSDVLYRAPEVGEWPVMSTLAHLSELLPYWAHQAAAIAAQPGRPVGRDHDDPDRIGAIQQHGHDSLASIVPRIRAALDECLQTLRSIPADAWQQAGQHPRRGRMTVTELVDAFLVAHADEHAAQVQATLEGLEGLSTKRA